MQHSFVSLERGHSIMPGVVRAGVVLARTITGQSADFRGFGYLSGVICRAGPHHSG